VTTPIDKLLAGSPVGKWRLTANEERMAAAKTLPSEWHARELNEHSADTYDICATELETWLTGFKELLEAEQAMREYCGALPYGLASGRNWDAALAKLEGGRRDE
jgi:hypothetical protein